MAEPGFKKTRRRVLTRRGVIWLGQTCNLKCHFCYFIDRINSRSHPEHAFMSLEKARAICTTLVERYDNNAIDIQGGEPTIYPHILELVRHCRDIGLLPSLITNAITLAKRERCVELADAGIRDCLVSVNGLDEAYDSIVGLAGAHTKLIKGIENLRALAVPVRFNCVLSKRALPQLGDIARLAASVGARVVNFIAFNPFEDQEKAGKRSSENVPSYGEVVPPLTAAMDLLEEAGIEHNVRYFPICMVEERHRKAVYDFQQLPYDLHEWDFASWSWTGLPAQRSRADELDPVISLEEATVVYPAGLNRYLRSVKALLSPHPRLFNLALTLDRRLRSLAVRASAARAGGDDVEWLYRANAKMRARDHCKYVYAGACRRCDARHICDGFHGDYAALFGASEARPLTLGGQIDDPRHYISQQDKVVEEEDHGWAL